jgi:hypothetical protein
MTIESVAAGWSAENVDALTPWDYALVNGIGWTLTIQPLEFG